MELKLLDILSLFLLGCPIVTFKSDMLEKINTLAQADREVICKALFYTVNWFIEVRFLLSLPSFLYPSFLPSFPCFLPSSFYSSSHSLFVPSSLPLPPFLFFISYCPSFLLSIIPSILSLPFS